MADYLRMEVLPIFEKWVTTEFPKLVETKEAFKWGQKFIKAHINPTKISSRGEVYNLFEDVAEYAEAKREIYFPRLNDKEQMDLQNMESLAWGIVWAIDHDGFDTVKYNKIDKWGSDIMEAAGSH